MVDIFRELLDAALKEHSREVQRAASEREVRHITEERLDHPTGAHTEKEVLKHMEKETERETPRETTNLRKTAVWFRQAGSIALA